MRSVAVAACLLSSTWATAFAQNISITSFSQAKRHLHTVYRDHWLTLYSACAYGENKVVDYTNCSYHPRRPEQRGGRIEWEHVVPAADFGRSFAEWREGHPDCVDRRGKAFRGRHCAAKVNDTFRHIEADLYNLFPEIGEINALRSNLPIGMVPGAGVTLALSGAKLGGGVFEPPDGVKGDIARVHLYMDDAYPGLHLLSVKRRKLFLAWGMRDPVDAWECERALRIARIQGNINRFVAGVCDNAVRADKPG